MNPEESGRKLGVERASIYDWINSLVLVSYAGGPELSDLGGDAFGITKAPIEAKLGIYLLTEISSLRVMVQKARRGEEKDISFDSAFFIPWSAIQMIDTLGRSGARADK